MSDVRAWAGTLSLVQLFYIYYCLGRFVPRAGPCLAAVICHGFCYVRPTWGEGFPAASPHPRMGPDQRPRVPGVFTGFRHVLTWVRPGPLGVNHSDGRSGNESSPAQRTTSPGIHPGGGRPDWRRGRESLGILEYSKPSTMGGRDLPHHHPDPFSKLREHHGRKRLSHQCPNANANHHHSSERPLQSITTQRGTALGPTSSPRPWHPRETRSLIIGPSGLGAKPLALPHTSTGPGRQSAQRATIRGVDGPRPSTIPRVDINRSAMEVGIGPPRSFQPLPPQDPSPAKTSPWAPSSFQGPMSKTEPTARRGSCLTKGRHPGNRPPTWSGQGLSGGQQANAWHRPALGHEPQDPCWFERGPDLGPWNRK